MEPLSAAVEEQAPDSPLQETPVQQVTSVKDDEEPMDQEESHPVIQEESDPVSQDSPKVNNHLFILYLSKLLICEPAPYFYRNTYVPTFKLRV